MTHLKIEKQENKSLHLLANDKWDKLNKVNGKRLFIASKNWRNT